MIGKIRAVLAMFLVFGAGLAYAGAPVDVDAAGQDRIAICPPKCK